MVGAGKFTKGVQILTQDKDIVQDRGWYSDQMAEGLAGGLAPDQRPQCLAGWMALAHVFCDSQRYGAHVFESYHMGRRQIGCDAASTAA